MSISRAERLKRKALFASMLQGLREGEWSPRGLNRALMDCWFAYHRGSVFLNQKGNPNWFNTGDLENLEPHKFKAFHRVSKEATKAIARSGRRRRRRNLVKDHAIPLKALWHLIVSNKTDSIETILRRYYRVAIITRAEDNKLTARKLQSKMPSNWKKNIRAEDHRYARYHEAKIAFQKGASL